MTTKRKRTRGAAGRNTATVVANKLGLAHLTDRVHAAFSPFLRAALDSAIGVRQVYEHDPAAGQWTRVTDPDQIAALLNQPEGGAREDRLIIYTQDPDARLLEGLLTFLLGGPFDPELYPVLVQGVEVDAETGETTVQINEAFLTEVCRPSRRGPAPPPPRPVTSRRIH